ncbi:unnamed protein product [Adineta steineri]|uniref:Uncharacterized protein n=1 Tax=Adineta steineri TaxID=433720 RepID=A0A815NIB1_9BILA|nr:unnamed protein product [Adineta steineri]CAF4014833.1 unnamed protein product [Adineta steineri]
MKHELLEVFIQIIMPMREWYIMFCNQDNLNKYSLNQFTLHVQDIPSAYAHLSTRDYQYGTSFKKIKTLHGTSTTVISELSNDDNNCLSYYLLYPYLALVPGIETTFLPVRIQIFIYSSKTKTKMNQSTNIEVRGNYYDNICGTKEPILTFKNIVIQQIQSVQSGRWSMEKTIYDKLNLTTDLPNAGYKLYLNTIIKDYCMKRVSIDSSIIKDKSGLLPSPKIILNNQLNSIRNQDLIESIEPFNELAAYYAQMAIKDLDLDQQHHPLLNVCRSLASTLHSEQIITWHSIQLRLIQLCERFPRLKLFLIILNKYGLHLKDILSRETNGLDIFFGDDEIEQLFHSICQYLQLQYEQQQTKDNSFQNYRLRIFWLTDSGCSDVLPILVHISHHFHLIFGFIDQWWSSDDNNRVLNNIQQWTKLSKQIQGFNIIESILNENETFKQNEELLCGTLSRILQIIKKSSPHFHPFVYVLTDHAQFNNDFNLNLIASLFIGLARNLITGYERYRLKLIDLQTSLNNRLIFLHTLIEYMVNSR